MSSKNVLTFRFIEHFYQIPKIPYIENVLNPVVLLHSLVTLFLDSDLTSKSIWRF